METKQIPTGYIKRQKPDTASYQRKEKEDLSVEMSTGKLTIGSLFTYQVWKGIMDRVLATVLVVVLSPLMAIIALIIRLTSSGSVIFRREQVRENGKKFIMYKFRTMKSDCDDYKYKAYLMRYILEDAPYKIDQNGQGVYKVTGDSRVTGFGAILRKTNLDELLQIFNILKGEMSFIGPRPDVPFAVSMYNDWQLQRLGVKPGISGLWQVSKRKELSFNDMVKLDIEYINKQSLFLDTKILMRTIGIILKMDGS